MNTTKKIRLIKKHELAAPETKPKSAPKNVVEVVKGWMNRRRTEMQQHPRERFDALFVRS